MKSNSKFRERIFRPVVVRYALRARQWCHHISSAERAIWYGNWIYSNWIPHGLDAFPNHKRIVFREAFHFRNNFILRAHISRAANSISTKMKSNCAFCLFRSEICYFNAKRLAGSTQWLHAPHGYHSVCPFRVVQRSWMAGLNSDFDTADIFEFGNRFETNESKWKTALWQPEAFAIA